MNPSDPTDDDLLASQNRANDALADEFRDDWHDLDCLLARHVVDDLLAHAENGDWELSHLARELREDLGPRSLADYAVGLRDDARKARGLREVSFEFEGLGGAENVADSHLGCPAPFDGFLDPSRDWNGFPVVLVTRDMVERIRAAMRASASLGMADTAVDLPTDVDDLGLVSLGGYCPTLICATCATRHDTSSDWADCAHESTFDPSVDEVEAARDAEKRRATGRTAEAVELLPSESRSVRALFRAACLVVSDPTGANLSALADAVDDANDELPPDHVLWIR
jgi:hypothetical protein